MLNANHGASVLLGFAPAELLAMRLLDIAAEHDEAALREFQTGLA